MLPVELSLTVALKVTDCPNTVEGAEELTVVDELALLIVWPPESVPVLVLKSLSPL